MRQKLGAAFHRLTIKKSKSKHLNIRVGLDYLEKAEGARMQWELLRFIRREAQYEHTLLMGRVNWYITSQSFLIAAFAAVNRVSNQMNPANQQMTQFSAVALPALAIAISILAWPMINGATETIDMWRELRNELVRKSAGLDPESGLNSVVIERWRTTDEASLGSVDNIHMRSLLFPRYVPLVFIVFWLTVFML